MSNPNSPFSEPHASARLGPNRPAATTATLGAFTPEHHLACMEVHGGNQAVHERLVLPRLEVWVHSAPHDGDEQGGDVHSLSSCGTGRISRLVLADVSGHGAEVASFARGLRRLMARFVNHLDQTRFVEELNQDLARSGSGRFATSVTMTYFSPSRQLDLCNAGHPQPLLRRAATGRWTPLHAVPKDDEPLAGVADPAKAASAGRRSAIAPSNLPLGVLEPTRYEQFGTELEPGDLVLAYTDGLSEARDSEGVMLGEEGLIALAEEYASLAPGPMIDAILARVEARRPDAALDDDLTLMLLRCTGGRQQRGFAARAFAGVRFIATLLRALVPLGERPPIPWPELSAPNVLGPFWPPAARAWKGPRRRPAGQAASSGRQVS